MYNILVEDSPNTYHYHKPSGYETLSEVTDVAKELIMSGTYYANKITIVGSHEFKIMLSYGG